MAQYENKGILSVVRNATDKLRKASNSFPQTNFASYRVKDIILDDTFEDSDSSEPKNTPPHDFKYFGEWNGIGTIIIEPVNDNASKDKTPATYAYPLFPNIKQYPLKEEIVWVIQLADADSNLNVSNTSNYYLPPINIWNSQIHNAIPNETQTKENPNTIDDYKDITSGSINADVRRITNNTTNIDLGKTFNESNVIDIHPLLPYEGDIIYEGRFGNSIRFGSTIKKTKYNNNWSSNGNDGDPITIIRNGQSDNQLGVDGSTNPWVPSIENIDNDQSSIYLTSTQQISLELSTDNIASYDGLTETPTIPELYSGKQILLNSGRLIFNAKNDHIILSADKSVHLVSNNSINIDTVDQVAINTGTLGKITLVSPKIHLGKNTGTEGYVGAELQSLVLGENLEQTLTSIIDALEGIALAMNTAVVVLQDPITGRPVASPIVSLNKEGPLLGGQVAILKDSLNILLSKNVKTI